MAVRVAGFARGGAGVTPAIAQAYVSMLNAGVHPVVPTVGSIGAADLMHMAAIAAVAMGEGQAELGGELLPGGEALRRAGIAPIRLAAKDGLTLISANGVAIGHAALVVDRARRLLDAADAIVAVSFDASRGNPSVLEPAVAAAKPVPGQAVSAARIRDRLEGSRLCHGAAITSVQDPLSFRVVPQVHGAAREVVAFAEAAVEGELAAMDDNPLVVVDEGRMVSNGNFHPMLLALALDAIRPAIAHVGQLSDRRTGQIWDALAEDVNAFSPEAVEEMLRYGSPLARYSGAALVAELRLLAGPATLDVPPLDLGVEDHATNAPLAARRTEQALALAEDVLAVELLTAAASLARQPGDRAAAAPATRELLERVAAGIAARGVRPPTAAVHEAAREALLESV
jgi:histidine ammonia-lyase